MSIPRKGSRRIVVDGVPYMWRIRRKAARSQTGPRVLHVLVALAQRRGRTLSIVTSRSHPGDRAKVRELPVSHADIAAWVRLALDTGWDPCARGAPFMLREHVPPGRIPVERVPKAAFENGVQIAN